MRVSRSLGGDDRHGERLAGDDDRGDGGGSRVQRDVELPGRDAAGDLRLGGEDALTVQVQYTAAGGEGCPTTVRGEDDGLLPGPDQPPHRPVPEHRPGEAS